MLRRFIIPILMLFVVAASMRQASPAVAATLPINFTRGTLTGAGFSPVAPTAITIGPDGRLYVADGCSFGGAGCNSGKLQAVTIANGGANSKTSTAVQQITTAADLQEVYGLTFNGNDASAIYVSNTISGFGDAGQAAAGTFPGKITKLSGAGYATRTDIITGLPISNSGHETNDLKFGPDGRLYIAQGSQTNAGVPNTNPGLFQLSDTPLSGAILVADINATGFNGAITYNPPNTYSTAVVQTGGNVSVYAPGLRNPYGLFWHSNGKLYATDNGPNAAAAPDTYGNASTGCATDSGSDAAGLDELNLIVANKYYGQANRNRGLHGDGTECVFHYGTEASSGNYQAPIEANLPASSDGIVEYKSNVFGGQLQGDLLYAAWVNNDLHRVKLSANGLSVVSDTTLATGLTNALSVAVDNTDGTIYVAEWGSNKITYFRPDLTAVSSIGVTAVTPNAGPIAGGQAITITGTNFTTTAESTATIGGQPVTNLVVQNSTTMTGTTSPNTAGLKNVVVTNSIGSATLTNGYNYVSGGGTVPPVANAGNDITAPISHENHGHVTLDGSASFDPDGFIASYNWTDGGVTIATQVQQAVELVQGVHIITLTVTDNGNFTATDQVRVNITSGPQNLDPYFCFDVDGNRFITANDLALEAAQFNKRFGQTGYTRMKDWNADRIINSIDLAGTAEDLQTTYACPLEDQMIRDATAAMEQYQNVNAAIAAGFVQVTQFVPQQGRHMVKSSLYDTTFNPVLPEGLLYEPDSGTPGGWRLGGAIYIMPIQLNPLVPDGFPGTDDAWHYHDFLCFYPNGTVTLDNQAYCTSHGGTYLTNVGWLLHLWNYVPSKVGRYIEDNPKFVGLP